MCDIDNNLCNQNLYEMKELPPVKSSFNGKDTVLLDSC